MPLFHRVVFLSLGTSCLFFSISPAFGNFNVGVSYSSQTFDSDLVDQPAFSVFGLDYDYRVMRRIFPDVSLFVGSSLRYSSTNWQDNDQDRAGQGLELTLNSFLEWTNKTLFAYGGLRIPLYSNMLVGSTFSAQTTQGTLESSAVTTYSGSGYELVGGGEYMLGRARQGKYMFRYSVGAELMYVSKTYNVENTKVVSSFSDYDGPVNHSFGVAGTAASFLFKLRFTPFLGGG